jgi:hypothetical protein
MPPHVTDEQMREWITECLNMAREGIEGITVEQEVAIDRALLAIQVLGVETELELDRAVAVLLWTGSPTPHPEFLEEIADKLVAYGDDPHVDWVLSLRARAKAIRGYLDA